MAGIVHFGPQKLSILHRLTGLIVSRDVLPRHKRCSVTVLDLIQLGVQPC